MKALIAMLRLALGLTAFLSAVAPARAGAAVADAFGTYGMTVGQFYFGGQETRSMVPGFDKLTTGASAMAGVKTGNGALLFARFGYDWDPTLRTTAGLDAFDTPQIGAGAQFELSPRLSFRWELDNLALADDEGTLMKLQDLHDTRLRLGLGWKF